MLLQDKDPATGEKRCDDLETWILSGGANKSNLAGLDERQEKVLLSFIEAVNFVQKQDNGFLGLILFTGDLTDVVFASRDRGKFVEVGVDSIGVDAGDSGFTGSW